MRRLKTFPHRLPTRIAYLESRGGKISRGDRDKDVNDPFVGANYEPTLSIVESKETLSLPGSR